MGVLKYIFNIGERLFTVNKTNYISTFFLDIGYKPKDSDEIYLLKYSHTALLRLASTSAALRGAFDSDIITIM